MLCRLLEWILLGTVIFCLKSIAPVKSCAAIPLVLPEIISTRTLISLRQLFFHLRICVLYKRIISIVVLLSNWRVLLWLFWNRKWFRPIYLRYVTTFSGGYCGAGRNRYLGALNIRRFLLDLKRYFLLFLRLVPVIVICLLQLLKIICVKCCNWGLRLLLLF